MPSDIDIVALPAQVPPTTQCKSTLIVSSLGALRHFGHFDAYVTALDAAMREELLSCIAGVWLPIDRAIAHYHAIDALGLSPNEQLDLGAFVATRLHESFLKSIVKLAASAGVTPWVGLRAFDRFYFRVFDGGGVRVVQLGPKDARIDIVKNPLAGIPYFVQAYRGLIAAGAHLFVNRVVITTIPKLCTPTTVSFRIAWA